MVPFEEQDRALLKLIYGCHRQCCDPFGESPFDGHNHNKVIIQRIQAGLDVRTTVRCLRSPIVVIADLLR